MPTTVAALSICRSAHVTDCDQPGADGSEIDIQLALRESLPNGVVHGTREDSEKLIEVLCRCGSD
jgi:anti-sigma regulatory factor (Ser/Thr protein kinase)